MKLLPLGWASLQGHFQDITVYWNYFVVENVRFCTVCLKYFCREL